MGNTFNILVVEDEVILAEMTEYMLLELNYSIAGIVNNFESAIQILSNSHDIDMAILDIGLDGEKSGLDLGREINEKFHIPFIYLTSSFDPETIELAAQTSPAGYLLKPYTKEDLFSTIEMVKQKKLQSNKKVIIKDGDLNIKIDAKDIYLIKSDNNYIEIYTDQKKYLQRSSIESFMSTLNNPNFIRIHRSYVANIRKVNAINGQYVIIGEDKYPLSRTQKDGVLKAFMESN